MRHLLLLILPAIFGLAFGGNQSSGEQNVDYDPLVGPGTKPKGPLVQQAHGTKGDPIAAAANIPEGGNSQGPNVDYDPLVGPGKSPNSPIVVQQHGYNGAPQINPVGGTGGGSSNDNDGGAAGGAFGNNPQIIPSGGDSNDNDGGQAYGGQNAAAVGGSSDSGSPAGGSPNMAGGSPNVAGGSPNMAGGSPNTAGGNAGGSSNGFEVYGVPNAAPAVGGADTGHRLSQNQALTSADGMPAGAIAGVVVGVIAVAAIGTAVAVVVLRSGASTLSAA